MGENGSNEITSPPKQVDPAYEHGLISAEVGMKFPKLRLNNADEFFVLYESDSSGIKFIKWNGAGFDNYASFSGDDIAGIQYAGYSGNNWGLDYGFDCNDIIFT